MTAECWRWRPRWNRLASSASCLGSSACLQSLSPWRPKTQRCSEDRELNQARSKPNTVDWPVRTARTIVHHHNSTQYCNTETVPFSIFPFLQTNIISQMWPNRGKGDKSINEYTRQTVVIWPDLIFECRPMTFRHSILCTLSVSHQGRINIKFLMYKVLQRHELSVIQCQTFYPQQNLIT